MRCYGQAFRKQWVCEAVREEVMRTKESQAPPTTQEKIAMVCVPHAAPDGLHGATHVRPLQGRDVR